MSSCAVYWKNGIPGESAGAKEFLQNPSPGTHYSNLAKGTLSQAKPARQPLLQGLGLCATNRLIAQ